MSYADLDYYKETYLGYDPGDDTEIQKALTRAVEDIDMRCLGPLTESDYHSTQWDYLKKANCAQAEYYLYNGDLYNEASPTSEAIGKYSRSAPKAIRLISVRFTQYLSYSGILASAVTVQGRECYGDFNE